MSRIEREKLISLVLERILKDLTVGQIEDVASLIETIPDEKLKQYVSGKDDSK